MFTVDQQIIDDKIGDCLRACVCTILALPPEQVPNFSECGFLDGLDEWLGPQGLGLGYVQFGAAARKVFWSMAFGTMPALVGGDGPRLAADGRRRQHVVVGRMDGLSWTMLHDPHPSRAGLFGEPWWAGFILPKTAEAIAAWNKRAEVGDGR